MVPVSLSVYAPGEKGCKKGLPLHKGNGRPKEYQYVFSGSLLQSLT